MSQIIDKALALAKEKHKHQTYRGGSYVDNHILKVVDVVKKYTNNELVITAAVLHDIVEDTDVRLDEIKNEFGSLVADLVWRLTDEPGINREEKKKKTYPKISANYSAVLIKLADRFVNMSGAKKLEMYKQEYPEFKQALYRKGKWERLWKELDRLANVTN